MKNMLLIMQNEGYLLPPDQLPEQKELWDATWKRVNRFLPDFQKELYPEEDLRVKEKEKSVAAVKPDEGAVQTKTEEGAEKEG
jgi:brefeldin A-resistance guanine nucleotide exchange factor 1